jgi:hypothetical protein
MICINHEVFLLLIVFEMKSRPLLNSVNAMFLIHRLYPELEPQQSVSLVMAVLLSVFLL